MVFTTDMVMINNINVSKNHPHKDYGYYSINTGADYYVPLSIMYELPYSVYTSKKLFSLVDKVPPDKYTSSSSGLYHLKRRTPPDKTVNHDMCSTSHIPTFFSMNAFDSMYLLTKYGENSSVYHKLQKRRPSMVYDTSKINTISVKITNHNFVKY